MVKKSKSKKVKNKAKFDSNALFKFNKQDIRITLSTIP